MDGSLNVGVFSENGSLTHWNIVADGVAGRVESSGDRYYYLMDHLGSTRAVIDDAGLVQESHDYYPFGLQMPGRDFNAGTKELFTGKERDTETGWDYFGARYYDASIGRWMVVDPLADRYPSHSPYNYVINNPVNAVDPDGEDPTILARAGIGGLVGGLIGGGLEGFRQYKAGKFDFGKLAGATGRGAITGALAGATFGTSLITQTAVGSVAEVVAGGVDRALSGEDVFDTGEIVTDAISGATGGVLAKAGEKIARLPIVQEALGKAKDGIVKAVANRTGATVTRKTLEKVGGVLIKQIEDAGKKLEVLCGEQAKLPQRKPPKLLEIKRKRRSSRKTNVSQMPLFDEGKEIEWKVIPLFIRLSLSSIIRNYCWPLE